jgi:hypothetical protein
VKQISKTNKYQPNKQLNKGVKAKVYLLDISKLINIRRELAEKYMINGDLEKSCDHNIILSIQQKKQNIVKTWELVKFLTNNSINYAFLNPDLGMPWSCSMFGRPLINKMYLKTI